MVLQDREVDSSLIYHSSAFLQPYILSLMFSLYSQ